MRILWEKRCFWRRQKGHASTRAAEKQRHGPPSNTCAFRCCSPRGRDERGGETPAKRCWSPSTPEAAAARPPTGTTASLPERTRTLQPHPARSPFQHRPRRRLASRCLSQRRRLESVQDRRHRGRPCPLPARRVAVGVGFTGTVVRKRACKGLGRCLKSSSPVAFACTSQARS